MAKKNNNHYIAIGLKEKKSARRDETEPGRMLAGILDRIPEGFDLYADYAGNPEHTAQAVADACGRYIRYCPSRGWMVYRFDEGRWADGAYPEAAVDRVIIHFGELLLEGAELPPEERYANMILNTGYEAVKKHLKSHPRIIIDEKDFDADPDLINCKGELHNLRSGESRPAEPEDHFTKSAYCKPGETPAFPKRFNDFLEKITSKDGVRRPDLALFLMSWFGYCLTGDTGAAFFLNFHGGGQNGKSVLLKLMMALFGDYAAPISEDLVIENRFAGQFDLAALPGIRLAVLADTEGGQLNMKMIKHITTGEPISAKRKFLKDFMLESTAKIAVGTNEKLTLRNTGMSARRRVRMVPFDYTVPDGEIVPMLEKKLLEEAPDILAMLIFYAREYYRKGGGPKAFAPCPAVDEASSEYLESEDLVGRYVKERTEPAPGNAAAAGDLYKDFLAWAEGEGVRKKISKNKFGDHLTVHVPKKKRISSGIVYLDILIKGGTGDLPGKGGG